jgi:hypothetical protein
MSKSLLGFIVITFAACAHVSEKAASSSKGAAGAVAKVDTSIMMMAAPPVNPQIVPDTIRVEGDFNGDGQLDTAFGVLYRKAATESGKDEYVIRFSSAAIRPLVTGYGEIRLINEGDLNGDTRDDLTVYQAPLHGCTYVMTSWSYGKNGWRPITEPWAVYSGCNYLSDEDLQNRIVVEDGIVYYYQEDEKDEHLTLVKKEMVLK